jgi:hypothetical protein
MKRSKIFLGLTTAVLAVAGVAAAKRFTPTTRFYITSNQTWCTQFTSDCNFTNNSSDPICLTPATGAYPLYTKGPVGAITDVDSRTKCLQSLYYDKTGQ